MHDILIDIVQKREKPIDITLVGLGFMSYGFFSLAKTNEGIRIPLIITKNVQKAKQFLEREGYSVSLSDSPKKIHEEALKHRVTLSDNLDLIAVVDHEAVIEATGTVAYGTDVCLRTIRAKKHLVTMNPELQVTVGAQIKGIANTHHVIVTDIVGDQPGSLTKLINHAKFIGFEIVAAGTMKQSINPFLTKTMIQKKSTDEHFDYQSVIASMDGTRQSVEMSLVANYFSMGIIKPGMVGYNVNSLRDALKVFPTIELPKRGFVDYLVGKTLPPGIFVVATHANPKQQKYLKYLGLGDGPRYLLFEPYHLHYLELTETILKAVLFKKEAINNTHSTTGVFTYAKQDLVPGVELKGSGSDYVYGRINYQQHDNQLLPIGFSRNARLKKSYKKGEPIRLSDVTLPIDAATILSGLVDIKDTWEPPSLYV